MYHTGSVMSKKAAESLNALSLEVTYGKAALIKTRDEAQRLAWLMVSSFRHYQGRGVSITWGN